MKSAQHSSHPVRTTLRNKLISDNDEQYPQPSKRALHRGSNHVHTRLSHEGPRAERKALRHLYTLMPLLSQLIIIAYTAQQGHWIMAVTVMPALVGYLAVLFPPQRHSTPSLTSNALPTGTEQQYLSNNAEAPSSADPSHHSAELRNGNLHQELGLSQNSGHTQEWREIVGIWVRGFASPRTSQQSGKVSIEPCTIPLGTTSTGPLLLSLPHDGPHALVAGTTGSGKSVLLRSWCLALAICHPPSALNLVLLDFKGGATFDLLSDLPHTVGCVSDLSMQHAIRALKGIELELKRREILLQRAGVSAYADLDAPPPRMVIVVDEFHALRQQLPEAEERLGRIASLGRSLGMHIILSTQNPLGQIGSQIKANIALRICLRVQDPMQSIDVLGDSRAATIHGNQPGYAYCQTGEGIRAFRVLHTDTPKELLHSIQTAYRFTQESYPAPLFTPPLPSLLQPATLAQLCPEDGNIGEKHGESDEPTSMAKKTSGLAKTAALRSTAPCSVTIGLQDDGVHVQACSLSFNGGNMAIIGPPRSGKSTLALVIAKALQQYPSDKVHVTFIKQNSDITATLDNMKIHQLQSHHPKLTVLLCDVQGTTAKSQTDLFNNELFDWAMRSSNISVILTADSVRQLRRIEYFPVRVVFPTGEYSNDVFSGIPSSLLKDTSNTDISIPGRGFIIGYGRAQALQCVCSHQASKDLRNPLPVTK